MLPLFISKWVKVICFTLIYIVSNERKSGAFHSSKLRMTRAGRRRAQTDCRRSASVPPRLIPGYEREGGRRVEGPEGGREALAVAEKP